MFKPGTLARLSPLFLQYAMLGFSSPDVMRFLAHRVNVSGEIPANYRGELTMDFKHRVTGDRVKYRMDGNPLKGYGKAGTLEVVNRGEFMLKGLRNRDLQKHFLPANSSRFAPSPQRETSAFGSDQPKAG